MYDLTTLRQEEFPITQQYLYFNNAGIAPLPARSQNRLHWAADQLAEHPGKFFMEYMLPLMEALKAELAGFINAARADEIVPITTTSAGLNAFAQSLDWQPGDNLLFCEIEFPSNAYPWMSLERDGVEVRQVPDVNGGLTLAALEPLVDERTRLVTVSAIQFFTGHRTDLATIGEFCHERDILFVVDAIQAIGHMPIDVQALHIDVLATGGQKSLLATPGLGFMYIREALCARLQPRIIAANSTVDYFHWLDYDLSPAKGAARFAAGTPNVLGLAALQQSLELLQELGVSHIDRHTRQLTGQAIDLLTEVGYEVITPRQDYGPIVTFRTGLNDADSDALVAYLNTHNVSIVKYSDAAGVPHGRLSFHCFNSSSELEQFAEILASFQLTSGPDW